jgi:[protein-PII] uridylyltransferase
MYGRELERAARSGGGGIALSRRRAAVLDGLLSALFCAADAASRKEGHKPGGRLSLVAVGSYGRGTLSLQSDIDVIFLCDDPDDAHLAGLAEGFLYPLWDIGLKVGHAVRGLEETLALARTDISTATTLLDLRRIGGDASIVRELLERGRGQVFGEGLSSFLDALEKDLHERHERFGGSLYLLEPEVKLGRGGLRDIDVGLWAARARWPQPSLEGFVNVGAMQDKEVSELRAAQDMLWRVRNLLHLRAKRTQDRLTFQDQEDIAEQLGFQDGATLGVEQFMQTYYRHARNVTGITERLLKHSRPFRRIKLAPLTDLPQGIVTTKSEIGFERS